MNEHERTRFESVMVYLLALREQAYREIASHGDAKFRDIDDTATQYVTAYSRVNRD